MKQSRTEAYQKLLADRNYFIEFNGYLSNHVKHAIIALEKLNAPPERVQEYWEEYTNLTPYSLQLEPVKQPWEEVKPCSLEEWKKLVGKKEKWEEMCMFLEEELKETYDNDVNKLVKAYAPDLLEGLVGALTHGIIHFGWAIDACDSENPWMVIEGLAYLNFCSVSCHPENFIHSAVEEASPVDSLRRVASTWREDNLAETWIKATKSRYDENSGFHSELIPAGFQWELSKVMVHQHEIAYELPTWLDSMDLEDMRQALYKTTVLLYLVTLDEKDGHGNFLVLHLITSLWGLDHVLKVIEKDDVSRKAFKCFYACLICLLSASAGGWPSVEAIDSVVSKYGGKDKKDAAPDEVRTEQWPAIVAKAFSEEEEHNIKLVYVARELWNRYDHWSGFRVAAEHFTVTPNVGPNSRV